MNDNNELTNKVLNALSGTTADSSKPTLQVATAVFGKGASKRKVNPLLYKLKQQGYVKKQCLGDNGVKPQWYLSTKGREYLLNHHPTTDIVGVEEKSEETVSETV